MKTILARLPEILNQMIHLNQLSEILDKWNPERQLQAIRSMALFHFFIDLWDEK